MFDPYYSKYIKSARWESKRQQYFQTYGKYCRICGINYGPIQLHHMDYSRVGQEKLTDLVALCPKHHMALTKEWRLKGKRLKMTLKQFTMYYIKRERAKRKA